MLRLSNRCIVKGGRASHLDPYPEETSDRVLRIDKQESHRPPVSTFGQPHLPAANSGCQQACSTSTVLERAVPMRADRNPDSEVCW